MKYGRISAMIVLALTAVPSSADWGARLAAQDPSDLFASMRAREIGQAHEGACFLGRAVDFHVDLHRGFSVTSRAGYVGCAKPARKRTDRPRTGAFR